ncbi:MAG: serine protease [Terracidiphilus sp.]
MKDLRFCVWSITRLRPDPPGQNERYRIWTLGSGFFVAPHVFLTCHHVVNGVANPHEIGDKYQLVQCMAANTLQVSPQFVPTLGAELHLFPEKDAAILQVPGEPRPYVALGYSDVAEGEEIGVAGYPLPKVATAPDGSEQGFRFIYRVAKGVITSTIRQSLKPGPDPQTADLQTIEVNFLFVPGNSGGPIFDAETGRVLAYVHGFIDSEIVQRLAATSAQNISAGAPQTYVQALHAVYSIGIKIDAIKPELERFGATL